VLYEGANSYHYAGEGRLCAVQTGGSGGSVTGYLYNAEGARVAKGTMSNFACPNSVSSFATVSAQYLLDSSGDQVTELNGSGGWVHSNIFAAGTLDATYDTKCLHFHLEDWLGTRRMQVSAGGGWEEQMQSLPFGDGLNDTLSSLPTADDATEHHFTGKERDSESGNDYFGARYFASTMGRFLSPDPGPFIWRDPQTLNRYAYTRNNPLKFVDPTGMYFVIDNGNEQARQVISMLLRSPTGRALVGSIAADPRSTYVKQGRLRFERNGNRISATKGLNESITANNNGQGVLTGTTVTIDWVNAALSANGQSLFGLILKAYAHEFSHTADKNAAPNSADAAAAGQTGDRDANGNPCAGGGTECGSAEALALQILAELGDPDAYAPDAASDAEAGQIIDQGIAQENGAPPWALRNGNFQNPFGDPFREDMQRQCALGNPAACD
jgi:RHS repeat-associated protein